MEPLKRLTFPLLLGLAAYYAVFGGEHSWFDLRRADRAIQAEARELARLRAEVDSLRARADSLESDPASLERIARERYGMIREGEILYRFAEPAEAAGESGEEAAAETSGRGHGGGDEVARGDRSSRR